MPHIAYIDRKFSTSSEDLIEDANKIIAEYQAQGFTLTLRQLYYQFVARGFLANKQQEYKRLGSIINDGRLAGKIDWLAIEDRTRNLKRLPRWTSPRELIEVAAEQFRIDLWEDQPHYVEVWIEKDALIGVIEGVCNEFRVPYFACRGYSSQSEQWRAGVRFRNLLEEGKSVTLLHFGDHDPSGLDMTEDNDKRLRMFVYPHEENFQIKRLALNMDQVRTYNPPPNPAKLTDSRCAGYIERHGDESWELDALEPTVIAKLIRDEIDGLIDPCAWEALQADEDRMKGRLAETAANWED